MRKKLFTLLLAVAASVGTMFAEKVQIGDLYYNLDATNQTAEVTYKNYTNYEFNEGWGITTANIPVSVTYNEITYSVTSIGISAFCQCSGLTSVTIPNSVTSIGDEAFFYCISLTSITSEALTPPSLNNYVFGYVDKSIPLYVPAGSISAYKSANQWKDFTNILPISQQGLEDVQGNNVQCTKVVRNGQIYLLRGDKTYTLQGQEVK